MNAGSVKIRHIASYGSEPFMNIESNVSVSGNMYVTDGLIVLSEKDSFNNTSGGMIIHGGLGVKKNLNVGGNLSVATNALYVHSDGTGNDARIGVNTVTPRAAFDINATDAIIIPSGTNADKQSIQHNVSGMMRYNTEDQSFEGFSFGNWGTLGGAVDVDKDTQILVEQHTDEDVIRFESQNNQRMAIFGSRG